MISQEIVYHAQIENFNYTYKPYKLYTNLMDVLSDIEIILTYNDLIIDTDDCETFEELISLVKQLIRKEKIKKLNEKEENLFLL